MILKPRPPSPNLLKTRKSSDLRSYLLRCARNCTYTLEQPQRYLTPHTLCSNARAVSRRRNNDKNERLNQHAAPKILEKKIGDISKEEVEAHFSLLPALFYKHRPGRHRTASSNGQQAVTQIQTAYSMGTLAPIIHWHDDIDLGMTVVNVVTWDRGTLLQAEGTDPCGCEHR